MKDFILGLCSYGGVTDLFLTSVEKAHEELELNFKLLIRSQDALIGRSRSIVASSFLRANESDILLFVDGDILFEPSDVTKLYEAVKAGHDIIGGGYLLSSGRGFALRPWEGIATPDGQIQEVEYISTGFLAITRAALIQIRDKLGLPTLHEGLGIECCPYFESGVDLSGRHHFYMSEDWDFCDKAREAGLKIYWHSDVLVGHVKQVILSHTGDSKGV